ncbi:MAG: serine/threonine protein kinase, partial [Ardenticatenia bacterium]
MRIEPGVQFANRYLIERQLSRGGTATVWLATDEALSRRVAIKVFHSPDASLWREAKAAEVLDHPNIVTIYDVGEVDGQPYMVMEYVPGHDLRRLLDKEAPLSVERAARLFLKIAEAVAAIHERHLIHRDLKPNNIIVTPTERVKITDFGIARLPGERPNGDVWGTP